MSDIAILMTGVLMTKQPSSSNFINLPVIKPEQDMQRLINSKSSQLISEAKAASSQSIQAVNNFRVIPLGLKSKHQKSRIAQIKQVFAKDGKLAKLSSLTSLRDKFSRENSLMAKKRRYKLAFRKYQQVSYLNKPSLMPEQNSRDFAVASSQNLNKQALPNLKFNSSGVAVRALQRLLVANGYSVPVDGVFGALTESAVKAFQAQRNLKVDGIVGLQTWHYLTAYNKFPRIWS